MIKVTVCLPTQTVGALFILAGKYGTTVTEALIAAIETQKFLQDEVDKGNRLILESPTGRTMRQLVFNY